MTYFTRLQPYEAPQQPSAFNMSASTSYRKPVYDCPPIVLLLLLLLLVFILIFMVKQNVFRLWGIASSLTVSLTSSQTLHNSQAASSFPSPAASPCYQKLYHSTSALPKHKVGRLMSKGHT